MSINVNSVEITRLLQLFPMAIPGAEQNVLPPGVYHFGIPLSIHSPSIPLFMVIDPITTLATTLAVGDSVRLWVNGQATSVIKPIKPGEENNRILMELLWGVLKDGLNTLYYEVTRVSGNKDQSTPILNVLFNNPASGITVSHPASIGSGQPATFTFTRSYPREYDVVTLAVGTWSKTIPYVHPANPITYTLTTADLQQIGDGTHPVSATVVDQLSNRNVSPTTPITISANQKIYNPPIIVEAEPGKILDVAALNGRDATIHGRTWTGISAGQQVWLKLTGRKPDGSTVTLQIWDGGASQVNAIWVSQGFWPKPLPGTFLSQLVDGSSLLMEFWVSEDRSNNFATATKFADQVYSVAAVTWVDPTIISVKAGTAAGPDIPNGGFTTETTLVFNGRGTASQQLDLLDNGTRIDTITVSATSGYSHTLTGQVPGKHNYTVRDRRGIESDTHNLTIVGELIVDQSPAFILGRNVYLATSAKNYWAATEYRMIGPENTTYIRTPVSGLPPYSYRSGNVLVATVDSNSGLVSSTGNGTTEITVTDALQRTQTYPITCGNVQFVHTSPGRYSLSPTASSTELDKWIDGKFLTFNDQELKSILDNRYFFGDSDWEQYAIIGKGKPEPAFPGYYYWRTLHAGADRKLYFAQRYGGRVEGYPAIKITSERN
ncbi:hypothetical protein [Pseudomonas bananamidigenes]|uniref:hypothetical protein n=1 Tax=Pseudomonas bananamidigenes TaxID=2843610 RepID=UPI0008029E7B|nr:hypothetical protein [Pseudomonas bananamidigenes]